MRSLYRRGQVCPDSLAPISGEALLSYNPAILRAFAIIFSCGGNYFCDAKFFNDLRVATKRAAFCSNIYRNGHRMGDLNNTKGSI